MTPPHQSPLAAAPADQAGRLVGPWRLLRPLGEGGMGVVWLAERADGRFVRQVALKLLRAAGSFAQAAERFREEASILATLDHPGIARLLDVGQTVEGCAYLVTEFVDGLPLDEWRRREAPSLRQRLQLLRGLCAAVSHAHRSLVVHRDLKPQNILIDRTGQPKLLDFGLARLVAHGEVGRAPSVFRACTLAYASPEQIEGRPASTATDVFALGIVLYELCTGIHPFRRAGEEMATLHAILACEPVPPSRAGGGQKIGADLDAIILRALEKTPARRYADARALGEDIERLLQHQPISARRLSPVARLGKWMRRHRSAAVAAATGGAALGMGWVFTRIEHNRARRSEAEAVRQRDLAREMAVIMVDDLGAQLARLTGPTEARLRLLEKAAAALRAAAPAEEVRARAELHLAQAYRMLGNLDGALAHTLTGRQLAPRNGLVVAALANLEGEIRTARYQRTLARAAFAAAESALGDRPSDSVQGLAEAQIWTAVRSNAAHLTNNSGRHAEARRQYLDILAALRGWLARWPDDPELLRLAGKAASGAHQTLPAPEADTVKAEALRWLRRAVALAPNDPAVRQTFANVLGILALRTGHSREEKAAGVAAAREARDEKRRLLEADPANVIFAAELLATAADLSVAERNLQEDAAARATLDEAIVIARRFAAAGGTEQRLSIMSAGVLSALAFWHAEKRERAPTVALLQEAIQLLRASLERDYHNTVARGVLTDDLALLGEQLAALQQIRAAEAAYQESLWWRRSEIRESGLPNHYVNLARTLQTFGEMLASVGRRVESLPLWREALLLLEAQHAQGKLAENSPAWRQWRPALQRYLAQASAPE